MSDITDKIDRIRAIFAEYDAGMLSHASCLHDIGDVFISPLLDCLENGDGYMTMGSCCCSAHPPDRTFKVKFTIEPHGFTARRCDVDD